MFYKLIEKKRNEWLASDECTIKELLKYIEQRGMMRDAQLDAIKTYLFLKIACRNQPLWRLFVDGVFNDTNIEIELRDLKQVLDEVVVEYEAEWELTETRDNLFKGRKVELKSFHSDRVLRKIEEVNLKGQKQSIAKGKTFKPIEISDEGLETIEWLSLDCSTADKQAPWHSDAELKIDRLGYVVLNGKKTHDFWDATIKCNQKPLRMKIRNICGDETIFVF